MRKKNIVIAGAGPGMGNHIAEVFGKQKPLGSGKIGFFTRDIGSFSVPVA